MITLKVEKRNPEVKAKKLRRDGFVCGVLYGKEMKSLSHSAHGAGSPPLYQSQQRRYSGNA